MEKEKILELFIKGDRQTRDHLWMGYPFMRDEFDYLERNGYQSFFQERDIKKDFEHLLASRTRRMESSAVREILKVISEPGVVSLAGGIPSPESFPVESINRLLEIVEKKCGAKAFQYGSTEGFPPLREALAEYIRTLQIKV